MTAEEKKEYGKLYREKNKDKIKEYNRKWREDNVDYHKEYFKSYKVNKGNRSVTHKKYYEKNKEKLQNVSKLYYANNKSKEGFKAKRKSYVTRHYEKNKKRLLEKHKEYYKVHKQDYYNNVHRRRAKEKFTDINSKWLKQLQDNTTICEVCNRKMEKKSIDHILPLNVGGLHIKSNIRIICLKCNLQRPKNGSDIIQYSLPLTT